MSNNSIQLASNTSRTTKVDEMKPQPEISLEEKRSVFTQDINNLGNQAIKENWCSDYLTDRIFNYAAEHSETSRTLRFNSDRQVVKATADNFLGENRDCQNPDEGPTFFECLWENKAKVLEEALECGGKLAKSTGLASLATNALLHCSDIIVDVVNCIQPRKK